ncbi:MAG: hypothetical protein V8S87_05065 [Oscillospiraceae bacterium]
MKAANKKRKTVFIPAAGWIPLTCAFFLFCIGALYIVTGFIPLPEEPIVLDYFASIVGGLMMVPVLIFGIFCAVVQFALWCRPIVLTENEMVQGFIFKRRCAKTDITGIGIASIYGKDGIAQDFTKYGVYAVTGPYDKALIDEMGIGDTWFASCVRAFWKPKKGPIPDSVYPIGYKLERYNMLKEWLGQTSEE